MSRKIELGQRAAGVAKGVRGLGLNDHICLTYEDPREFRKRMVEFLNDGVALGQRIHYAGSASTEQLRSDLAELEDLDTLIERGVASVMSIAESNSSWVGSNAHDRVATYASLTNDALAAGFTGLRGVSEATSLIRTEQHRVTCAQAEHLTDRFMTANPLSSMCAYRLDGANAQPVAEMACLHPLIAQESVPFRLYARQGGILALAGEIDYACADLLDKALKRTLALAGGAELAVDAAELTFIDHRGLLALDRHADSLGTTVVLRGLSATATHVAELLDLTAVRVESIL